MDDLVAVRYGDIRPFLEQKMQAKACARLPDHRKARAETLKKNLVRAQSIGVWHLWEALRRELGLPADALCNFSHSGFYVMVAVWAESAMQADMSRPLLLGCDLERSHPYNDRLARRVLTDVEYACVQSRPDVGERAVLLQRYWVRKESVMKATRLGLALDPRRICTGAVTEKELCPVIVDGGGPKLYIREIAGPEEDMRAAVCLSAPDMIVTEGDGTSAMVAEACR